jgi:CMP-2-keto-3-deoxyoctulosonic acid synthetase
MVAATRIESGTGHLHPVCEHCTMPQNSIVENIEPSLQIIKPKLLCEENAWSYAAI